MVEPIQHDEGKRRAALMVSLSTSDLEGYVHKAQAEVPADAAYAARLPIGVWRPDPPARSRALRRLSIGRAGDAG